MALYQGGLLCLPFYGNMPLPLAPLPRTPNLLFSSPPFPLPSSTYHLLVYYIVYIFIMHILKYVSFPLLTCNSSRQETFVLTEVVQVLKSVPSTQVGTLVFVSMVSILVLWNWVSKHSSSTLGVLHVWFDLRKASLIRPYFWHWLMVSIPWNHLGSCCGWGKSGVPVHLAAPNTYPSPRSPWVAGFGEGFHWQEDYVAKRVWNSLLYTIKLEWVCVPKCCWTRQPFFIGQSGSS